MLIFSILDHSSKMSSLRYVTPHEGSIKPFECLLTHSIHQSFPWYKLRDLLSLDLCLFSCSWIPCFHGLSLCHLKGPDFCPFQLKAILGKNIVAGETGGSFRGRTAGSGPVNRGSNPCPPATMVPSSSGLGRRPLTPVTRVRVPLGLPGNIKGVSCSWLIPFSFRLTLSNPVSNLFHQYLSKSGQEIYC